MIITENGFEQWDINEINDYIILLIFDEKS